MIKCYIHRYLTNKEMGKEFCHTIRHNKFYLKEIYDKIAKVKNELPKIPSKKEIEKKFKNLEKKAFA